MPKNYFSVIIFALIVLSTASIAEDALAYTVKIAEGKFVGTYLVNETGFTLYYSSNDSETNGISTCGIGCTAVWPPFYVDEIIVPDSLNPADFSTTTGPGGRNQTAYRGWPLYLYTGDLAPGSYSGNSLNGTWHIVDPSSLGQLI